MDSIKHTNWNLDLLFQNDDDPAIVENRKLVSVQNYAFINKWKDRVDFLENHEILRIALDEYEQLRRNYATDGDEGYYFALRCLQDQSDPKLKARYNQMDEHRKKIWNDLQFFTHRIARIPKHMQRSFLESSQLQPYKHFLEREFRESRYLLTEPEEKIMTLKSGPSHYHWVRMTSTMLSKEECDILEENGDMCKKQFSELPSFMNSKNKNVRDHAAIVFNKIIKKHLDVAEAEINAVLHNKKISDELRGMHRPDKSRHVDDDIDSDIVDTLVNAVSEHYTIVHDFYKLKAKLLGLDKLEYHERNLECGKIDKEYQFDEALSLTQQAFSKLDPEFADILKRFVQDGNIDVFPKKGKRAGACCIHHCLKDPVYILLNHTNKLNDVLTLAHEMGHAINYEVMKQEQHAINFGTTLSTAEVASTFMEDFVLRELLEGADDELKLSIMMMKLNEDVSTIFRQIACYMFEQHLHKAFREKRYLSKKEIGDLFQNYMGAYMGPAIEQSPGSENWWVHWSHIRSFFYNYSYASGLLISKALQRKVREDPQFIHQVKKFLSSGLSESPKNIFLKCGIDISNPLFWQEGIAEVQLLLRKTENLARSLGKI